MNDNAEKDKKPLSMRDYLQNTIEAPKYFAWVWQEFVSVRGRRLAYLAMAVMVLFAFVNLAWPYAMKWFIDGLTVRNVDLVIWGGVAVIAVIFIDLLVSHCDDLLAERLSSEQIIVLDTRMSKLFFEKSLGQHRGESQELSPANVREGRNAVRSFEKAVLYRFAPTVIRIMVIAGLLFWLHWLAGLAAIMFCVYSLIWAVYLSHQVMTEGKDLDKNLRAGDRLIDERWRGVGRVKTFGKEDEECANIAHVVRDANLAVEKFWIWYAGRTYLRSFFSVQPFLVLILVLSAVMVLNGEWTVGTVLPFVMWTGNFIGAVRQFGEIERQINGNMPAIRTLHRLMTLEPAVQDAPDAIDLPANGPIGLSFREVSYSFAAKTAEGKAQPVLKNVSFDINPGEKVAVIGESGAGKTTLSHLALRSMDPTGGAVLYDGIPLTKLRLKSVLDAIGNVPQGAPLFDGTVRELVTYGLTEEQRAAVTDEEIWSVLKLYQADLGDRFSEGLDSKIGRDGIELSGGERQRLSAVMAFMRRGLRLLVMDEPTSSLDSSTEKAFQESLAKLMGQDVSALIIAHRLSTVRDCDKFVVLKRSSDVADGESQVEAIASSFEELYVKSPSFRRLADDQGIVITESKSDERKLAKRVNDALHA